MTAHRGRTFGIVSLALAALATMAVGALPAGGSAPGSAPGVTATTITVGQVDTLSGPVPGLFLGAKDGTLAYLDYVNSHGGVDGRKLVLQADDDQFSASQYAIDTAQLVKTSFALVGGFSLFDNAGTPAVVAAKIPDVTPTLTASRATNPYNYASDPLVVGGAITGPYQWIKKHFGDAYLHVGVIDTDVSTAEIQSQAVYSAMQSIGYKIVANFQVTPFTTNFLPDVLKFESAGVQLVYVVGMAVNQVADLAQNMHQQGFVPKFFGTNGVAYDSSYIPDAGQAANGTYDTQQSAMYLGEDAKAVPAVALFDKWMKKVNPSGHIDTYALYGWSSAQLFVQALRAAGPDPTRAGLFAQLNKITSFNASGLTATGNPAQKLPEECWILTEVVDGRWKRVPPDPKTGFVCSPTGFHYPPGYHPFVRHD